MLVVPADLPQVSPTDIEDVIDLIDGSRAVALVRASDGGTNLLACRPADEDGPAVSPAAKVT
jgi:2-phospho-L-lactate guanylyltransferase (CobY/MobA/RfbA family)